MSNQIPATTSADNRGDVAEAELPVQRASLATRRPAELSTFVASLVVAGGAVGLDLSAEAVTAAFVVVSLLPAIVSYFVALYREAIDGLDE